jgi:hypothetical protein
VGDANLTHLQDDDAILICEAKTWTKKQLFCLHLILFLGKEP